MPWSLILNWRVIAALVVAVTLTATHWKAYIQGKNVVRTQMQAQVLATEQAAAPASTNLSPPVTKPRNPMPLSNAARTALLLALSLNLAACATLSPSASVKPPTTPPPSPELMQPPPPSGSFSGSVQKLLQEWRSKLTNSPTN